MANLGEDFRNAARELKEAAFEFVAHAFNSASEKDMTAIAALKTKEVDSLEEMSDGGSFQMSRFSDELFSAVKNGDAVRMRELLDIDDSPENNAGPGMASLMDVVNEKKEDAYMNELIEIATSSGDYDLSMAALLLVASGGNPETAREMLKDIKDGESTSNYSEAALEQAIAKGNLSAAAIIKQRMRAIEFNQKAQSEARKDSLLEKCMNFFTGKPPKEEGTATSRFMERQQAEIDKEYEFINKLPPEEKATLAKKVFSSLASWLNFGPKA